MPPALKAYWAARRSSVAYKRAKAKRARAAPRKMTKSRKALLARRIRQYAEVGLTHRRAKRPRKMNPIPDGIMLEIRKGSQRLKFDGKNFSQFKLAKRFRTKAEAEKSAFAMSKKFPSALKGWQFYVIVP